MAGVARPRASRTVAECSWSATGRWALRPGAVVVLLVGLWCYGTGEALLIEARVGNTPWTVLSQGIAGRVGLSIGVVTILTSMVVLTSWLAFDERPGFGTLCNIVLIGVAMDVMSPLVPHPSVFGWRVGQSLVGVVACGFGCALYLAAHLGPGARDGLMTGLHRRLGVPIAWVRLAMEATVLVAGMALGGRAGLGTVVFALGVGHVMGWSFTLISALDRRRHPVGIGVAP